MNRLLVLSGPSGVGKSTMLFRLVEEGVCEMAPKYAERLARRDHDDIIHVANLTADAPACDVVYERYGIRYGVDTDEIRCRLQRANQVVIIGDMRALAEIRRIFSKQVVAAYLCPSPDGLGSFVEASIERGDLVISPAGRPKVEAMVRKVSEALRQRNNTKYRRYRKLLCEEVMGERSDTGAESRFRMRCESWFDARNLFEKYAHLFELCVDADKEFLPTLIGRLKQSDESEGHNGGDGHDGSGVFP